MRGWLGAILIWASPLGGAQKDFIGAAPCRSCHASQFASQSASSHARALYRAGAHPLAERFVSLGSLSRGTDFHFQFERAGAGLRVRGDDGQYVTELPVEWAFGAGDHAVTFVSRVSPEYHLEHSFSYYPAAGSLDLTPRHDALPAGTLHQAMGQPIKTRGSGATILDCFGCHSTGPVSASSSGEVQVTEPGVHCEVCHGPGSAHRDAAAHGDAAQAGKLIENPGKLSAEELNRFCGRCHRVIGAGFDWNSPWSARHQPPYLARSRCFQNSGGKLSCLTCHNPHERVVRGDAAYYRTRCTACHNAGSHPPAKTCLTQKAPDCVKCHMPAVAFDSHLTFANHWIGVYKQSQLKPAR
jgi:hypothetical protein